ncbi:uncharacterized protein [Epargyreus clarus]|uniref:uncharacterized protein n=1 Tax=Epargyreus clarus TaxID=520877 RepID=UPI003C2E877B
MINILSYVGMDLQSEVCLWTLLGLLRTIFDATLFKVNANLKQVWQMRMPEELTRPVQRVLRTMISGVILVQCFTVYVYLASYIVLLYPVFLEERPTLVLPWLLLAAIRKLLCELMSLALGLGTCVLLGPARPPCIKFLIVKIASITPAFYMWMLVFSYYHALKLTAAFKTFPAVLPPNDHDYGLELAVRRRRTKSLQGEGELRRKLISSLYGERNPSIHTFNAISNQTIKSITQTVDSIKDLTASLDTVCPLSVTSNRTISDIGTYEDWFGNEVVLPPDTDRILEQFGLMLLRIAAYLKKEEAGTVKLFNSNSQTIVNRLNVLKCTAVANDDTDTPPDIGSSKSKVASYLTDYPQIFMKKSSDLFRTTSEHDLIQVKNTFTKSQSEKNEHCNMVDNIECQNFISYEVTRQTKTIEIEVREDQSLEQNICKESDNNTSTTKECISEKNVKSKDVKCKAINTTYRLKSQNKSCTDKKFGSAESLKRPRDKINNRKNENITIQKSNIKKEKGEPNSSEISASSTSKNSTSTHPHICNRNNKR